jgi:CheY-like chemotaxis protein
MLIDDDPDDHEFFKLALKQVNRNVKLIPLFSGHQALMALNNPEVEKPDYIFIDRNMPVMNGQEFLQKIKSHKIHSNIPVIMLSTSSSAQDIKEALRHGAIDYIVKPSSLHGLTQALTLFFL